MTESDRPTRRNVIGKAAVGTAVAWTAPVVLSGPALAAGSVTPPPQPVPGSLDWALQYPKPAYPATPPPTPTPPFPSQQFVYPSYGSPPGPPPGPLPPIPDGTGSTTLPIVGGTPLGVQIRTSDPSGIGVTINDRYRNFLVYWGDNSLQVPPAPYFPPQIGGLNDPYFLMQINPTVPATQVIQTEMEFARPVTNLTFHIDGIDRQNGSNDIVTVTGFIGGTGGTPVLPVLTKEVPASLVFAIAGNVMTGALGPVSNASNLGNSIVNFPGTIDTIRVTFQGTAPSNNPPFGQYIGIRDMSFLVSPT